MMIVDELCKGQANRSISKTRPLSESTMADKASVLSDSIMAEIAKRASDPESCDRWETLVSQANYCRRPVRLKGYIEQVDSKTCRKKLTYSTSQEPDGVLLKACGSRRETLCSPCSAIYKRDVFQLIKAGLCGGKKVPVSVTNHPSCFVTLTAPSFGRVHRANLDGKCNFGVSEKQCVHGNPLSCQKVHRESDDQVGTPICSKCYQYEETICFNLSVSELWRRTMIYSLRYLGQLVGLSSREVTKTLRLSYVKVFEFQKRGAVHIHALVRLDAIDERDRRNLICPPDNIGADILKLAIERAARNVSAPLELLDNNGQQKRSHWGTQIDIKIVHNKVQHSPTPRADYLDSKVQHSPTLAARC